MRVAIFTNTYSPHTGGVARSVLWARTELEARGHPCMVIAPVFDGQPAEETGVLRVPAIKNFRGSGFSLRLPLSVSIGETIKAFRPDLIHSHHPFLLGDSALRMASQWSLPLVFTHHTRYEMYAHYLRRDSAWLKRFIIEWVTAYAQCCDAVIAPGTRLAQILMAQDASLPVEVIPTGIDLRRFAGGDRKRARQSMGIPPDVPVVGHLGRLAKEKNLDFLIRAIVEYQKRDTKAHLLLAGEGPEADLLRNLVVQAGFGKRLHCLGVVPAKSLPDVYAAMDVFAFSSLSETQGIVLAEAMAAGLPVVALAAPGVSDILIHGINGYLLDATSSPEQFAVALEVQMRRSLSDPNIHHAVRKSVESYASETVLKRLIETYSRLVSQKPSLGMGKWERFLNRLDGECALMLAHSRAFILASSQEVEGRGSTCFKGY